MKFYDNRFNQCVVCGRVCECARHHLIPGRAYRSKSDEYGLYINLCPDCHNNVHFTDGKLDHQLREMAQRKMMYGCGWTLEKWIAEFGKNYLEEDN